MMHYFREEPIAAIQANMGPMKKLILIAEGTQCFFVEMNNYETGDISICPLWEPGTAMKLRKTRTKKYCENI